MSYLLPIFKAVSVIFAVSAIATGIQAIFSPLGFSRSFGLPITTANEEAVTKTAATSNLQKSTTDAVVSYVSLMGIRQFATGVTIVTFAYQEKWTEIATLLSILGVVVAGTDGFYLFYHGNRSQAAFHAIPGALIALLATSVNFTGA